MKKGRIAGGRLFLLWIILCKCDTTPNPNPNAVHRKDLLTQVMYSRRWG